METIKCKVWCPEEGETEEIDGWEATVPSYLPPRMCAELSAQSWIERDPTDYYEGTHEVMVRVQGEVYRVMLTAEPAIHWYAEAEFVEQKKEDQ